MSSNYPISVRIASKTRYLETTGDSSYYYSSQLVSNLALLKALKKLGQQLSWPAKATSGAPLTKQGSSFLSKVNQSTRNSRIESLINLIGTPGKEWMVANLKLIEKLASNQSFFNSKTIGLLTKGLGYSGRFNPVYLLNEGRSLHSNIEALSENERSSKKRSSKKRSSKKRSEEESWFKSFNSLAKLAKLCKYKYYKRSLNKTRTALSLTAENFRKLPLIGVGTKPQQKQSSISKGITLSKGSSMLNSKQQDAFLYNTLLINNPLLASYKQSKSKRLSFQKASFSVACTAFEKKKSNFYFATMLKKKSRAYFAPGLQSTTSAFRPSSGKQNRFGKKAKGSFKTSLGLLPFYFTALGLITHSQVLRSTLVVVPIISGYLQSNLALADHRKELKIVSSSGLGLVSASPYCYIARSPKRTALNFFFQIPAKLAEKTSNQSQYHQVYLLAGLQGLQKSQKRVKSTYASVRWSL